MYIFLENICIRENLKSQHEICGVLATQTVLIFICCTSITIKLLTTAGKATATVAAAAVHMYRGKILLSFP